MPQKGDGRFLSQMLARGLRKVLLLRVAMVKRRGSQTCLVKVIPLLHLVRLAVGRNLRSEKRRAVVVAKKEIKRNDGHPTRKTLRR